MAMSALAAHKLRSALTLLGVLVGVFSIIVVMTAMRVMQIEHRERARPTRRAHLQHPKIPGILLDGRDGWEKIWRRKNITLQQAEELRAKATLAQTLACEAYLGRAAKSSP